MKSKKNSLGCFRLPNGKRKQPALCGLALRRVCPPKPWRRREGEGWLPEARKYWASRHPSPRGINVEETNSPSLAAFLLVSLNAGPNVTARGVDGATFEPLPDDLFLLWARSYAPVRRELWKYDGGKVTVAVWLKTSEWLRVAAECRAEGMRMVQGLPR